MAAATSGQSDSTIETKFEPLNGLPTISVVTSAMRKRIGELMNAVGRIDIDEDRANLAGGELGEDPLGDVHRPDADMFAWLDPQPHEPGGRLIHTLEQLAPATSAD